MVHTTQVISNLVVLPIFQRIHIILEAIMKKMMIVIAPLLIKSPTSPYLIKAFYNLLRYALRAEFTISRNFWFFVRIAEKAPSIDILRTQFRIQEKWCDGFVISIETLEDEFTRQSTERTRGRVLF